VDANPIGDSVSPALIDIPTWPLCASDLCAALQHAEVDARGGEADFNAAQSAMQALAVAAGPRNSSRPRGVARPSAAGPDTSSTLLKTAFRSPSGSRWWPHAPGPRT